MTDSGHTKASETGMKAPKRTLRQIYVGIALHGVIFGILGIIFMRPIWMYELGLLAGLLGAMGVTYNMYTTIESALDMHPDGARKHVTLHSLLRLLGSAALMIVAILIDWTAFVGVTVGLIGLKISAFMNPFIRRFI